MNLAKKAPAFNREIWKSLESNVRMWVIKDQELYVVTGHVLTDGPFISIGTNEVLVPKRYFKVILDYLEPEIQAIGFILPNENLNVA